MCLKKQKKIGGITIIALVITIIIIIILASITINFAFGDKGLVNMAEEARDQAASSDKYESSARANLVAFMNEFIAGEMGSGGEPTTPPEVLTAPNVNLNGYTEDSWTNKDITINLSSNGSNISTYQYSKDNGSWENCGSQLTLNTDQNSTYKFRTVSSGGETSPETKNYSIKRDTVGPTFKLEATAPEDDFNRLDLTVTEVEDNGSGVSSTPTYSYYYKLASDSDNNYVLDYTGQENEHSISELEGGSSYTVKVTVMDLAGNVGEKFTTAGTSCFVAGTKVLTEDGLKNIEDIKVGDMVYTINMDNNQRELKPVLKLFKGKSDEIYKITIQDNVIEATPKHQFYIVDKGWVRAYDLEVGDMLVAKDNQDLVIEKIEHNRDTDNLVDVYNLTVEGNHNYLVTDYEILVHNVFGSPSGT